MRNGIQIIADSEFYIEPISCILKEIIIFGRTVWFLPFVDFQMISDEFPQNVVATALCKAVRRTPLPPQVEVFILC